jgi:hypothetical protein
MPIREYYPKDKPFKMLREDPFGIVFEIYTHSYELTYSSEPTQNKSIKCNRLYCTIKKPNENEKSLPTLFYIGCFL